MSLQDALLDQDARKFHCELTERIEMDGHSWPAGRGQFDGDFAIVRFVEDTMSLTSDNAARISHYLQQIADTLVCSSGLGLGRAQIFVVIEKKVVPPPPPKLEPMPKRMRGKKHRRSRKKKTRVPLMLGGAEARSEIVPVKKRRKS